MGKYDPKVNQREAKKETSKEMIEKPLKLWLDKLPKRKEFLDYLQDLINNDNVETSGWQIGYMEENIKIAKMIPKDKIVIDIGCGFGFQHILYQEHKQWIGIQTFREGNNIRKNEDVKLKVFTKNAKIIRGDFKDVWEKIGITEENKEKYFGIANHSLWHDPLKNKEDIEIFKKLFPKNNWATDLEGKQIKVNK